ncbi:MULTISPECIES: TonB-dependent receptor [Capnocytophaga]|uniref:TonB-dependent receptor n=1 Tax=Capnocytophaga TaxID=1016 RepID=UPI00020C62B9|nr:MULTISPECIES: TonB-dependent receptor [unclassified Capnocytophaga]KHE70535.1 TonB-dependent siderophore receptor [Capnocytophaga sp. oral taxon 329 str. F0087]QGS17954.1 TonB-dependent siderophore receptor [Capnocytophaga sp. FDAARGOS_737]
MKKLFSLLMFCCFNFTTFAQQTTEVRGRVTDENKQPLIGVDVVLEGTSIGISTNDKGFYELHNVPVGKQTIVFSYLGFKTLKIRTDVAPNPSGTHTHLDVQLSEELTALQEVEVIGRKESSYKNTNSFIGTKTASALKEVPQSVGYVTKELILDQGATTVNEVVKNISGVNQNSSYNDFSIRGFRATGNRNSGNLLNGMRAQTSLWKQSSLANIERVEVIKGPASALFGNAAPGGVINRVTKKPLFENKNSITVGVGSWNTLKTYGDFTGPLNPKKTLLYRLNLGYEKTDSFRDLQGSESIIAAPSFSYIPNEKTHINVDFVYQNFNGKIDRGQSVPADGNVYSTPISRSLSAANDFLKENTLNTTIALTHKFSDHISLNAIYLNSSYSEDMLEHTQANLYYKQIGNGANAFRYADPNKVMMTANQRKRYFANNSFNTYFNFNFNTGILKHKLLVGYDYFISEQKAGSSSISAQGYLSKDKTKVVNTYTTTANVLAGSVLTPTTNVPVFDLYDPIAGNAYKDISKYIWKQNTLNPYEEYSHGVYVQEQIDISIVKLLVGLRQEWFTETLNKETTKEISRQTSAFIPRVGLVVEASENINLYSTWVKGFQPQGANIQSDPDRYGGPFDYIKSELYEVGLKTEWFNKRLSATLAIFKITQENSLEQSPKAGKADWRVPVDEESNGFELDVAGQILPNFSVVANYAYTDARIVKLKEEGAIKDLNVQRPSTPRHAANLWTKYIFENGSLKGLGAGIGVSYASERLGQVGRRATAASYPDYTLLNAVLYYKVKDVQLQLNVNNVLNRTYWISGYDNLRNFPGAPRNINASVTYRF